MCSKKLWAIIFVRWALALEEDVWPSCLLHGMTFRAPRPIYVDVRRFISHPDKIRHRSVTYSSDEQVGMALRDQPHELGEMVLDVVKGSQAERAGVRSGWIIKEVDEKKFSPTERLKDVADDFGKARKSGATLRVTYDVRTYFDCLNATCTKSDRFPTESMELCAEACNLISECEWWAFGPLDSDNMCLMQGKSKGFIESDRITMGSKKCVPKASWGFSTSWPKCVMKNTHIYAEAGAAFADVRPFIKRSDEVRHRVVSFTSSADIGLILRDKPSPIGEVVDEVTRPSQAWDAGVRKGWIIVEVSGKSFRKGEGVDDADAELKRLKGTAPALIVKFDVKSSLDCTNGDCSSSDKLPASSVDECASFCSKIHSCRWWTYGTEEEDKMCWLRTSARPVKATEGSQAGDKACSPSSGTGLWLRVLGLLALGAAAIKFKDRLLLLLGSVLGQMSKKGTGKYGVGVPALELSKDCGLDDDDTDESYSLMGGGRSRKRPGSMDDFSL
jgi:hypothetical protein